ncbi:uncharacterized protein ACR2FA_004841 [Aphomia sociella]
MVIFSKPKYEPYASILKTLKLVQMFFGSVMRVQHSWYCSHLKSMLAISKLFYSSSYYCWAQLDYPHKTRKEALYKVICVGISIHPFYRQPVSMPVIPVYRLRLPKELELKLRKAEKVPSWKSNNEGIHERVNFDDTIWGFNLAGGAYYNTPLRITEVKHDSRAEYAGMKVGDTLNNINGIDTQELTVQQAHDLILDSGIEIKLCISAPDVDEATYYVYQDDFTEISEEKRLLRELDQQGDRYQFKGAKTNEAWSIAWPCSKKRDIMYRESNCFLVPSVYEKNHP